MANNNEEFEAYKKELKSFKPVEVILLGTKEAIELIKENIVLAKPTIYQGVKPFALLLKKYNGYLPYGEEICFIYHRLGLVELGIGNEELNLEMGEKIIISDQIQDQQAQILQTNQPYGTPSSSK